MKISRAYYENKQLKSESYSLKKKKEGVSKEWHRNGNLKKECSYKNGQLIGESIEYHENGKVYIRESYGEYGLDGICEYWHDDGELFLIRKYKQGVAVSETWDHQLNLAGTIIKNIWKIAVEWAENENRKKLNQK
ncbi:MAG: toxin-antitoxin system YwqK family antitoxin [Cetobacterium sp.]